MITDMAGLQLHLLHIVLCRRRRDLICKYVGGRIKVEMLYNCRDFLVADYFL